MPAELCTATTVKGAPCQARALPGGDRCYAHRRVLDEAAVAQLVALLRAGNYLDVAALAAHVDVDDLPEEVLARLVAASAEGEALAIARISAAASDQWQAAAWLLERQYPERWGRPAVRPAEDSAAPLPTSDWLDELAGRRAARRSAVKP